MHIATSTFADFATDMGASVANITGDVWPILLVVAGVPFGFYVVKKIIALVPKR